MHFDNYILNPESLIIFTKICSIERQYKNNHRHSLMTCFCKKGVLYPQGCMSIVTFYTTYMHE